MNHLTDLIACGECGFAPHTPPRSPDARCSDCGGIDWIMERVTPDTDWERGTSSALREW